MTTPVEVVDRIASNYYTSANLLTMHHDFCNVLDVSIDCFQSTTSTLDSNTCSNLWSIDTCLASVKRNETIHQLCPVSRIPETKNSTVDVFSLHCNETTGFWNKNKRCNIAIDETDGIASLTSLNQSQSTTTSPFSAEYFDSDENDDFYLNEEKKYVVVERFVTVGHALSLASLIVAITLFIFLRRLHCTRIYIHINLLATFILRGMVWILHVTAFEDFITAENKMELATLVLSNNLFGLLNSTHLPQLLTWKRELCDPYFQTSYFVRCQFYFVMLNYTVTANYYWLLIEGLYLALLLREREPNKNHRFYMKLFLVLGWITSWCSVIGAVIFKLVNTAEASSCWFSTKVTADLWIINVPILISVLINFIIFVWILTIVGAKLKGNYGHAKNGQEDTKWRLTKSTLALIPLLGIQYLVTVFFTFIQVDNSTFKYVQKVVENLFTSLQGFLVSLLYCFLNKEIQGECNRCWSIWKTDWQLKIRNRRSATSHTSMNTLYSNYQYRKPSAVSMTSTRRSDSIFTLGKLRNDSSPSGRRYTVALSGITEHPPTAERYSQIKQFSSHSSLDSSCSSNHKWNGCITALNQECKTSHPFAQNEPFLSSHILSDNVFDSNDSCINFIKPQGGAQTSNSTYKTTII